MLALHLILLIGLCYVLGRSARAVARSVRRLGKRFGVGQFALAFVLLGLATSMPEIAVSVFSAARGVPGLSLGNLIGANIVILSLLTGLAAIFAGKLKVGPFYEANVFSLFIVVIAAPAFVVLDGSVTRGEGIALLAIYALFMAKFYRHRHAFRALHPEPVHLDGSAAGEAVRGITAVVVLLAASYFLVKIAVSVATEAGLPPLI